MPHVEALAEAMGLKISLVQVITTPTMAYPATESYAFDPQMAANLESAAAGYLKEKKTELEQKGFQVRDHGEERLSRGPHNRPCSGERRTPDSDVDPRPVRPGTLDYGERGRPRSQGVLQPRAAHPASGVGRPRTTTSSEGRAVSEHARPMIVKEAENGPGY